eukprot:TRINITY_DN1911_c0_g1_i1.p1 TRINITY_DN1911_c0_g1~~TRINITY_DN1911_c0_g1_i1.p1  ORF type:complete len:614 (+),score=156.47 TRINITY_DN1911_c0_g1_i1:67-1842(+)
MAAALEVPLQGENVAEARVVSDKMNAEQDSDVSTTASSSPSPSNIIQEALPGFPQARPEDLGLDPKPLQDLHEKLKASVSEGNSPLPGVCYAVLRHGQLVSSGAFGVTDAESRKPWTFDTVCRMFSMTKTVAVCGLMGLVEDGLVSFDDPVSKYLPGFEQSKLRVLQDGAGEAAPVRCEVTIKHLLTHTSGISYAAALDDEPSCPTEEFYAPLVKAVDAKEVASLDGWCEELAKLPLQFQPGERWEYSYSLEVIGRVMEIVSGKTLDVFLRERVLEPLGMKDTGFSASPEAIAEGRLSSFYRRGDEERLNRFDGPDAETSLWSESKKQSVLSAGGAVGQVAGGLVSTLKDFTRLCLMLQQGGELEGVRVLREETVKLMCTNLLPEMTGKEDSWCLDTAGFGFGLLGSVTVKHPEANWFDAPGEVGWGGLAGTAWAIDRKEGLVVVSMCQVMYEMWVDEDVRKAVRTSLGFSEENPLNGEKKEEEAPAEEEKPKDAESGDCAEQEEPAPAKPELPSPQSDGEQPEEDVCTPPARNSVSGKRPFESPMSESGESASPQKEKLPIPQEEIVREPPSKRRSVATPVRSELNLESC